jgi:ribosomal protein S18 acetylase RimI-like enzyme
MTMESDSGAPLFIGHDTSHAMTIDQLDNPVWHALAGPHREHAIGRGAALHYPRDMAPFSAIAEPGEAAYVDLAADLPKGTEARLFRPEREALPAGWEETAAFPILQMVATRRPDAEDPPMIELGAEDVAATRELVAIAEPGPFGPRTHELGRYLGIRRDGRLLAMAGERLRLPGYVELSAICVHPEARGQGHAVALAQALMKRAFDGGQMPFLHVRPDNMGAVKLYRRLGFEVRREIVVLWRRPFS